MSVHQLPPVTHGAAPGVKIPPVTEIGMTSLALIIIGGIYLAAHLPHAVPLAPAILLLALSAALLVANMILLARTRGFNFSRFFQVFRWGLLAYVVTAGMIEYAFLRDGLSGSPLIVLTLSIVVYAVHVPILIAFTVARYDRRADLPPDTA
ncbi:MAG: hypothetical protein JST73_11740 [Actinobacteria bacterium]|nr:hypothetical protein [Actinomycetota bacterium]